MHLSELMTYLPSAQLISGHQELEISSVSANSATIQLGGLFAALKGAKQDGHDFIDAAIKAGAVAILSVQATLSLPTGIAHIKSDDTRHAYAQICAAIYASRPGMLVGVTGTNGKTSVVEYMRQIWTRATWPAATIG